MENEDYESLVLKIVDEENIRNNIQLNEVEQKKIMKDILNIIISTGGSFKNEIVSEYVRTYFEEGLYKNNK